MMGNPYSQWMTEHRRGSFPGLSGNCQGLEDDCYHDCDGLKLEAYLPTTSSSQSSYSNQSTAIPSYHMSGYSSYSDGNPVFVVPSMLSFEENADSCGDSPWMLGTIQHDRTPDYWAFDHRKSHDGLPATRELQQQGQYHVDVGRSANDLEDGRSSQCMPPGSISPKLLTLNSSSAAFSYSGSNHKGESPGCQTESESPSIGNGTVYSDHDRLEVVKEPVSLRRARCKLPDTVPRAGRGRTGAISKADKSLSSVKARREPPKVSVAKENTVKKGSTPSHKATRNNILANEMEPAAHRHTTPKRIESKAVPATIHDASSDAAIQVVHQREAKDDFLVRSKLAGMSYKDIRRQGKFTEAESTMRGRFRTLTKHKLARVRKPEWDDNDVSSLTIHSF
jgi:hypothetical protein